MSDELPKASPRRALKGAKAPRKKAAPRGHRVVGGGTPLEVQIAVTERRRRAWEMKLAGADDVTIGRALTRQGAAGRAATPHGYDNDMDDKHLADVVRADLRQAQDDRRDGTHAITAKHREIMVLRHYRALSSLWPAMNRGDTKAHAAGLGHMRAISKLAGLDEPTRVAISGDDPDVIAAYTAIMDRLRAEAEADDAGMPELPDGEQ